MPVFDITRWIVTPVKFKVKAPDLRAAVNHAMSLDEGELVQDHVQTNEWEFENSTISVEESASDDFDYDTGDEDDE